jgi:hypothetical protein
MKRVLARNVRVPAAAVGVRSRIIAGKSEVDLAAAGAQASVALFATVKISAVA